MCWLLCRAWRRAGDGTLLFAENVSRGLSYKKNASTQCDTSTLSPIPAHHALPVSPISLRWYVYSVDSFGPKVRLILQNCVKHVFKHVGGPLSYNSSASQQPYITLAQPNGFYPLGPLLSGHECILGFGQSQKLEFVQGGIHINRLITPL